MKPQVPVAGAFVHGAAGSTDTSGAQQLPPPLPSQPCLSLLRCWPLKQCRSRCCRQRRRPHSHRWSLCCRHRHQRPRQRASHTRQPLSERPPYPGCTQGCGWHRNRHCCGSSWCCCCCRRPNGGVPLGTANANSHCHPSTAWAACTAKPETFKHLGNVKRQTRSSAVA